MAIGMECVPYLASSLNWSDPLWSQAAYFRTFLDKEAIGGNRDVIGRRDGAAR
jgi:hypothetical protein